MGVLPVSCIISLKASAVELHSSSLHIPRRVCTLDREWLKVEIPEPGPADTDGCPELSTIRLTWQTATFKAGVTMDKGMVGMSGQKQAECRLWRKALCWQADRVSRNGDCRVRVNLEASGECF